MTSSHEDHQETLFDVEAPDDVIDDRTEGISHVDIARAVARPDEMQKERLDEMADKLGSYFLARVHLGLPPEDEPKNDSTQRRHLPGKPLTYPKRGNVRDFHDGGRSDEHRGGMGAPELGSEADDIMRQRLPELQSRRDRLVEENIRNDFEEDVIASEYIKVDAARSRAVGRYRGHIERHYPDMGSDEVNDLLADFAETLLPPSPLQ
jgi:hypothetical protein